MEMWELERMIDKLVDIDPNELPAEEQRNEMVAIRHAIDRLEYVAATRAANMHRNGLGAADGAVSTAAWLQHHAGQRARDAKRSINAGIALADMPLVDQAWKRGELSASAARTITRGRNADHGDEYASIEAALVELGVRRHFRDMDTLVRQYQTLIEIEPTVKKGLHFSETTGGYRLDAWLDQLTGSVVQEALQAATDPPAEDDARTPAERRLDALATICRYFLDHDEELGLDTARAPHVTTVLDWATFTARTVGRLDIPLHERDIHQLLCDCNLTRVITGPDGQILDVGRTQRLATTAQRKAIQIRDKTCRFPGCDRTPRWCEIHHVIPWEHGGPTDLDNLVMLCSHHHHVVHTPGWSAAFDGIDLTVTNSEGRTITQRRAS